MAVVLDSDAVVGFLDSGDSLHHAADTAVRELVREQPLVVSAVTYAEVLTGARLGHHEEDQTRGFFSRLISEVLPVDTEIADAAAALRAEHRALRMPDALILATASTNPDVGLVLSGDAQAAKVDGLDCQVRRLSPAASPSGRRTPPR
ncbi:MAG TPA: PIN domain-containing protein [Solirubrobacterales bacterium]|nr:PIN domain-containing protein [Solirubrobacterales bacterium]